MAERVAAEKEQEQEQAAADPSRPSSVPTNSSKPTVEIQYCTQCRWLLRAAYFAQELLSTFSTDLAAVSLAPKTGGIFRVLLTKSEPELESRGSVAVAEAEARGGDGEARPGVRVVSLWDRATDGGFPEVKELKRRVRDEIAPGRGLGHNEKGGVREGEAKGGVRHEEAKGAVQEAKVEEAKGAVQEAKVEEDEEQRRKTVDVDEAREDGKCAACKE